MESKRFLLDFVFSNMKLNGKKLELPLKQPFLAVQEMSKTNNWCSIVDAFQTCAIDKVTDVRLQDLVNLFGLSSNLI